uniref:Uncharacterized protein n=1 Tax=Setaria viridis TaxID=4556 RepID=A0A4U6WLW1_SETVI|nr:hypothetical protein SEVIR_1G178150v2 [Setaria viridis]
MTRWQGTTASKKSSRKEGRVHQRICSRRGRCWAATSKNERDGSAAQRSSSTTWLVDRHGAEEEGARQLLGFPPVRQLRVPVTGLEDH